MIIGIATVAAAVIGLLTFIHIRRTYKYKKLTYEVSTTKPLVSVAHAIRDRVEVKYITEEGAEVVEDLVAVFVTIRNAGTEAVEYGQGEQASEKNPQTTVTLDFGKGARVLGRPLVDKTPKNISVEARKDLEDQTKVVLHKFLLNPGQKATILTFLTNFTAGRPDIYAHLREVPELEEDSEYKPSTLARLDRLAESMSDFEFGGIFITALVFVLMAFNSMESLPEWESGTWVSVVSLLVLLTINVFNLVLRFGESRALSALFLVMNFLIALLAIIALSFAIVLFEAVASVSL